MLTSESSQTRRIVDSLSALLDLRNSLERSHQNNSLLRLQPIAIRDATITEPRPLDDRCRVQEK